MILDDRIKIAASQLDISVGGQRDKPVIPEFEQRDIEGPSAEIVDQDFLAFTFSFEEFFFVTVGQRGSRRLVDHVHDRQTGEFACQSSRLSTTRAVERGNRNHGILDGFPKVGFGVIFEFFDEQSRKGLPGGCCSL